MNWKNRLTNYNFWISIFSAVLLILQALKIEFDIAYVNEIFTAVLGLLVVIGIISDPTRTSVKSSTETTQEKVVEESENQTANEATKITLPINEKDEVDNLNFQNDFKAILNKISSDLEIKIKEMAEINNDAVSRIMQLQKTDEAEVESQVQGNLIQNENIEVDVIESAPAVAEMENPYIDLMK